VTAIAEVAGQLKAARLCKRTRGMELAWIKNAAPGESNWTAFADQCELGIGENGIFIAGFNSAGVVFYRIDVPEVPQDQLNAIVKLQTEARLPLPAEKMECCWRCRKLKDGTFAVTTAAAKKDHLQKFINQLSALKPDKIILDCEALVEAWRKFFGGTDAQAVVMSIGARTTRICMSESAALINAATLDTAMEDFTTAGDTGQLAQRTLERFAQDVISVLELFDCRCPVHVLSDGSENLKRIVSYLKSRGIKAKLALADTSRFVGENKPTAEQLYDCRVPIGLASMALQGRTDELAIFNRLYKGTGERQKGPWYHRRRWAASIAAAALAILVLGFYAADLAALKYLDNLKSHSGYGRIVRRQKLIKQVASQRFDITELLTVVNAEFSEELLLDSIEFRKGRAITITGRAKDAEQMYKFQQGLLNQKLVSNVRIQNASDDKKTKKVKFTIVFNYGSSAGPSRTSLFRR